MNRVKKAAASGLLCLMSFLGPHRTQRLTSANSSPSKGGQLRHQSVAVITHEGKCRLIDS